MKKSRIKRRKGAVAALVAILLVALLAMVAFCLDYGYMIRVNAELQNAADAAALAGASQLMGPQIGGATVSSEQANASIAAARTAARQFSQLNTAGSVALNMLSSDTVVGYMANPRDQSQTLDAWTSGEPMPNTVQVLLRRDSMANTPVSLFFARLLGVNTWNCTAKATAAFQQPSSVTGFNSTTTNAKLLPIAVDVNYWNAFVTNGASSDGTKVDSYSVSQPDNETSPPNNVTSGGDGVPEFVNLYPNDNSPGNFGLVCIGPPATDVAAFQSWIHNGASPSDLSYFGSNGFQATPTSPAICAGGPGLKSTLCLDLASIVGQPRIVPLFSSYLGTGSDATYTIVGFGGITIVSATGSGSGIQVIVQPIAVTDLTATTGSGSGSSFVYPSSPLGLTR
jgi:Flp pilus assembly protein TadG